MSTEDPNTGRAVEEGQLLKQSTNKSAALAVKDETTQRGLQSIVATLGLKAVLIDAENIEQVGFHQHELVIADEVIARAIRPLLNDQQRIGEEIKPALVAVGRRDLFEKERGNGDFDGVLGLPSSPAELASRLSIVLYSHRALAQRYRSALEELNLNRSIFRSVSNGVTVANAQRPDLPLMYVNPSFEMMTGYTLEEAEKNNCRFLQGSDRDQPGLTLIREAIAQKRQTTAILRNYRKDGSCFWNELSLSPVFNSEGELTHYVGIQQDVSDRVNMESALRESEKLAAVGRLASSISHEINNPLEAMMNLLYLARHGFPETPENAAGHEYLRQIDEELQRVKLIAAQSLRFYKQSSGPEALLVSTLIESVMNVYRTRMVNYGVQAKIRERSTQHIVGLASELRQVLSNLISNAIDAMKGDGGVLHIRSREATWFSAENKKGVLLTFADTGSGMSAETQRSLYKAFYTTKGVSGTGLGLWISKGIVDRHHGRLKVRSKNESGKSYTVFELFLPYQGASGTSPSSGLSDQDTAANYFFE